jgi:hypothetical protein
LGERDWGQLSRRGLIVGLGASVFVLTEVAYNLPIPADPLWERLLARRIRKALKGQADLGSAPEQFAVVYLKAYGFSLDDEQLVQRFLLSTDAFSPNRRSGVSLNFVTLYDPYESPCYSPLQG